LSESLNFEVTLRSNTRPNHATPPPVLRAGDFRWSDRFAESVSFSQLDSFTG
jgi:hypothetical protein